MKPLSKTEFSVLLFTDFFQVQLWELQTHPQCSQNIFAHHKMKMPKKKKMSLVYDLYPQVSFQEII